MTDSPMRLLARALHQHGLVRFVEHYQRLFPGCHLKDVKDATKFTILGQGDLNLVGTLSALKSLNYSGILSLEYEESEQNPIPDIKACLEAVRKGLKSI